MFTNLNQIGSLGSFLWSPDSSKIAYIAEAKNMAKEKSLFNAKLEDPSKADNKDAINEENYEKV